MGELYTAVLVECRQLKVLRFILRSFLENLDSNWNFLIVHGSENGEWFKAMIAEEFRDQVNRFIFHEWPIADFTALGYNQYIMSTEFHSKIPTETFLIFQSDTMISPSNKNLLKKFMQYDFVGAPWKWGGIENGGLSLRKKSKMLQILKKFPVTEKFIHEDSYFSKYIMKVPHSIPTELDAHEFSIETIFRERAFGLHAAWKHLPNKMEELRNLFPDIDILIEQQPLVEPWGP